MDNFTQIFSQFKDYLAPKLDMHEQAIYLYFLRHTHVEGKREATIGIKSAVKKGKFGLGRGEKPLCENVVSKKLRSLEKKGFVKNLTKGRNGTTLEIILPSELPGLIPISPEVDSELDIENQDFYTVKKNRELILKREEGHCFYCQKKLDRNNYVLDPVLSKTKGEDNSYRNVVAACCDCNTKKSKSDVEDFIRSLYRSRKLSANEFSTCMGKLDKLRKGDLRP